MLWKVEILLPILCNIIYNQMLSVSLTQGDGQFGEWEANKHPDLYIQYKATSEQKYMKTTQVSIKMYKYLVIITQNTINNGLKLWCVVFTVQIQPKNVRNKTINA